MRRLASFEVRGREHHPLGGVRQAAFGAAVAFAAIGARGILDLVAQGAGPYAPIYPALLIATLYARLTGGITTFAILFAWMWFAVAPRSGATGEAASADIVRLWVNMGSGLVIILFAHVFRSAINAADAERAREIERRDMMMTELVHRTKNNFAIVASLLSAQLRQEGDTAARSVLERVIGRIQSFALAYRQLVEEERVDGPVDTAVYLSRLVDTIAPLLFADNVRVDVRLDGFMVPNEQAVAMGLVLNEALTNSAKHAFGDGRAGTITVTLTGSAADWTLRIADDGGDDAGMGDAADHGERGIGGTGSRLMDALARQARGRLSATPQARGYAVTLHGGGAEPHAPRR